VCAQARGRRWPAKLPSSQRSLASAMADRLAGECHPRLFDEAAIAVTAVHRRSGTRTALGDHLHADEPVGDMSLVGGGWRAPVRPWRQPASPLCSGCACVCVRAWIRTPAHGPILAKGTPRCAADTGLLSPRLFVAQRRAAWSEANVEVYAWQIGNQACIQETAVGSLIARETSSPTGSAGPKGMARGTAAEGPRGIGAET